MPQSKRNARAKQPSANRAATLLTHFDASGAAHMVDVSSKAETQRVAVASGEIRMQPKTLRMILSGSAKKGDVLGVARIAAIQGAKRAYETIPLAHPISLTSVAADFSTDPRQSLVRLTVTAQTLGRTGVEIEALAAVSAGLLTVYDMCKSADRSMTIERVRLLEKKGGKSGHFIRPDE
jgi:cyclic pyranopterin phosphate synthase